MKIVHAFPREVRVIENVWIPMADGVRLAARIWLPSDAERHPVPAILEYMPYRKRDFTRLRDEPLHRYFAGHGYACIRLDLRGSGDSDGLLLHLHLNGPGEGMPFRMGFTSQAQQVRALRADSSMAGSQPSMARMLAV